MRPCNFNLRADKLRELLHYNPCTGVFTRKSGQFKDKKAGWLAKDGYNYMSVNGTNYSAARLAYLYVYKHWPEELVDHQDGNRSNDCFFNLRAATYSQNTSNSLVSLERRYSKYRGVSPVPSRTGPLKWDARIKRDGVIYYLGAKFETQEEAAEAYNKKAIELFGQFAIINKIER